MADNPDWAALVGVLRRIITGERNPDTLTAGLDSVDTAITEQVLARLAEPTDNPPGEGDTP